MIFNGVFAQDRALKGDGQVFWEEDFDWEDPDNKRGWSLPEGWAIEDNSADDNGFVWVWTKDSMQGPFARRDGGYILNSPSRDNGFLAIDLDYLNEGKNYMEMLYVNSSITLPVLDCSDHPSVIIGLEQMFKYLNANSRMVVEVSNDDGAHWAAFDMKMGTGSGSNVLELPNDEVAHYTANLSDVAGGQPNVTIKITWEGSILYFWMIDDIVLFEGWDYDLKMNHFNVELMDDRFEESGGFMYMIPKSQILPLGGFEGSVINYGDYEMTDVRFNVTIDKNHIEQFNASSETVPYIYFGDPADTLLIEETYTPVDFGHYELKVSMLANEDEQTPDNNSRSFYFHVTDSVFARTPDIREVDDSPWKRNYQYTHEGDIIGVEYNPVEDCKANSISVYISRSNLDVDFKFLLMEITEGEGDAVEIIELLSSETNWVDAEVLAKGWVTMPLDHDGVGENLKAGGRYLAAVQFWTYIDEENLINRGDAFYVGATQTYPGSSDKQWWYESYPGQWTQGSRYSRMIRLNIDNDDNIIDGIARSTSVFSLDQNYPNPFNSQTNISYHLTAAENVIVEVQDVTGRIVRVIEEGAMPAGLHNLTLYRNDLAPGMYYYTLKAGDSIKTKRMVIE